MQNYKLSVSKNGKKYTIVFKAETEKLARERVHKEWYSILGVEEVSEKTNVWNVFIFSAINTIWEHKHWKIVWDDIFKIYVKLRKNLEYDVKTLFSEADSNLEDEQKKKIIKDLEEEYNLFGLWKDNKKKTKVKQEDNDSKNTVKMDNFYLKKELDETYKLIDFVLKKIQNMLDGTTPIEIDDEQKERLKNVFNSIIKLKKSTNISKLKEVWELALIKVWEIELSNLEKKQEESSKKLLKETNVLLKRIWSKESFIEKDKDLSYIFNNFLKKLTNFFPSSEKSTKKENIDKDSHSYIKNILFLKKYREKLKENNQYIFKNLFSLFLNSEKRQDTFIKRRVIKQNITLFKIKEKGVWFSYTFAKKWFTKIVELILLIIKNIRWYLFTIVFIYTFTFLLLLNINYYYDIIEINYSWIFYFIIVLLLYITLNFARNLLLIILNFVILFFIIIFWVVNF